jgi:hypothetical protein
MTDQGSEVQGFRVEKTETALIKGIVFSSGYKSVSPNGMLPVCRVLFNIMNSTHRL